MNQQEKEDDDLLKELCELINRLCDSTLSPTECERLEQLVVENERCSDFYVETMLCHAGIAQQVVPMPSAAQIDTQLNSLGIACSIPDLANASNESSTSQQLPADCFADERELPVKSLPISPVQINTPDIRPSVIDELCSESPWAPLCASFISQRFVLLALLMVCMLLSGMGVYCYQLTQELAVVKDGQGDPNHSREFTVLQGNATSSGGNVYAATLVNLTNCRWDKSRGAADLQVGGALHPGQELRLFEGMAEIKSTLPHGGMGDFRLEGPLAMMLSSEGMPSLLYGKLTGHFTCDYDRFTLDTPLGRVIVSGDAFIGISAAANDVEVHVFAGTANFELWSIGLSDNSEQLKVTSGNSLRGLVGANGRISVERGKSRESSFVTPAALAASRLSISDQYVAAIRAAKPIAYWRFESSDGGVIRNEMANCLHCRVVGDGMRLRGDDKNRTAEFGSTSSSGYLLSDDNVGGRLDKGCTVEAWMKPTYYHHGAVFSLIDWMSGESPLGRHRLHIELCGPRSGFGKAISTPDEHPGRIRLINHSGSSSQCFSSSPYLLRKWQHIAAVRDEATVRMYADGKLVASGKGNSSVTPFGSGLRILMGQLFPNNPHIQNDVAPRMFVGELDEVALYDRALSQQELQDHYQLVRRDSGQSASDSRADL